VTGLGPMLRVGGTHEDVGTQIGLACGAAIRRVTAFTPDQLPRERSLAEQLALADEFREVTAEAIPWILIELDAAADAAEVDRRHLFAASIEEIWPGRDTTARAPTPAFRGCTDIAATSPALSGDGILVAHNNDLPAIIQGDMIAVEWSAEGAPTVFSLGVGPWLSAAWNSSGVSITGNELAPNDDRVGIPRLLLMTAVSRAATLAEAKKLVGHERRASSYNWIIADRHGRVACLEGSATAMVEMGVDDRGLLHHENHYTQPAMRQYERNVENAARSAARGQRVAVLLDALEPGSVTVERLRGILADHEGAPESICRHPAQPDDMQTVFWAVADPGRGQVHYGLGPPCTTPAHHYDFA
jgi:isopenicillin-N N-acyltransferase-like protein